MKTILVAIDESDNAARALDQALKLLTVDSLHIHLLTVGEPIHMKEVIFKDTATALRKIEEEHKTVSRKVLEPAMLKLKEAGISHDTHVEIGLPAQKIAEFARQYHCEMIVMGTRGSGRIRTLAVGSVANKVVHLSEVPVLLVK